MRAYEARGLIRAGKLCPHDKRAFLHALSLMADGEVVIRIVPAAAARRDGMNRYWRVVLGYVSEYTGLTNDDLHEYALQQFRPRDAVVQDGSSTSLSDAEFARMIEAFIQWAAETLHVVVPEERWTTEALR